MKLVVSDVGEKDLELLLCLVGNANLVFIDDTETELRSCELEKKIQNAVFVEDEDYERFLYYFNLRVQEEKRLKDIYLKLYADKEFRELDEKHSIALLNKISCLNKGDLLLAEDFKKREEDLNEKRNVVLKRLGVTQEDIKRHYVCDKCLDSGFIYGGIFCDCYKGRAITKR